MRLGKGAYGGLDLTCEQDDVHAQPTCSFLHASMLGISSLQHEGYRSNIDTMCDEQTSLETHRLAPAGRGCSETHEAGAHCGSAHNMVSKDVLELLLQAFCSLILSFQKLCSGNHGKYSSSLDEHREDGDGGKEDQERHKSSGEQSVAGRSWSESCWCKTIAWQDQQKLDLAERASARDRWAVVMLVCHSVTDAGRYGVLCSPIKPGAI